MEEVQPFKECTLCGVVWFRYDDLVIDPNLVVNGYQASFSDPEKGLFLITHDVAGCGTTLALVAGTLKSLYEGPAWTDRKTGTETCLSLCLDEGRLEECTAECEMAWVRKVLQYLRRHELPPRLAPESEA